MLMDNQRSPRVLAAVDHIVLEEFAARRGAGDRSQPVLP